MNQDYGMRISQRGYDVKTCSDKKCVFTSKDDTLKVVLSGVLAITIPAGSNYDTGVFSVYLDHGLDYTPTFMVNANDGTTGTTFTTYPVWGGASLPCSTSLVDNITVEYTMSSTRLTCYVRAINGLTDNGGTSPFWPKATDQIIYFKYYLFSQALS